MVGCSHDQLLIFSNRISQHATAQRGGSSFMFVETRGHIDCSSQVELQEQRQQLEHQAEHLCCFRHEDQKVRMFSADGSPFWRTLKVLTFGWSLSPSGCVCVCVSSLICSSVVCVCVC